VHNPINPAPAFRQKSQAGLYGDYAQQLDHCTGLVLDALEKNGLAENTLLVFTSDNGGSTAGNSDQQYPADAYPEGKLTGNNAPLRGQKGALYEGGIRVPTIANWPGKLQAGKCESPIHVTDWMPTICELARHTPSKNLKWDGANVWPLLNGTAKREPRRLYWVAPGFRARALRVGDWKLIEHGSGDSSKIELFDLANDPNETTNLASQMPERVTELRKQLNETAQADRDAVAKD